MILITNDDGIQAEGLWHLQEALVALDDVIVIAPDRERSATGMSITLHEPVAAELHGTSHHYAVSGTPVDCVHVALGAVLKERPQLLVSGINNGQNLGQDVHYSGTLAAAIQGTFFGIPSIAVSIVRGRTNHYATAAHIALRVAKAVLGKGLPGGVVLNVNVPNCPISELNGVRITRQDLGVYDARAHEDADNPMSYWIGGQRQDTDDPEGTDLEAIQQRYVSITPIQLDMTDHARLDSFLDWF